ncbi:SMI1/KNR4 family protein [Macrococcoides canis]|uniref:SMI1/KNR4 family protein n=1 Tax=Macrococcoides canis TaxID=1855823 RepID=UPI0020B79D1B|nr:SMI1/KNR4 family protein [Macrococcus canis]UTH10679.1 SMI1/KNR4 family protein [Macrococcus canis]
MEYSKLEKFIKVKGEKPTKSDIYSFESWRGFKLPEDFIEFSLKYPGAFLSAEFDAEDRPGSMISNFLRFSKEGYSSIYVDEAYDITDFGPYVLFGEDPSGNYIAFDYSKSELNPSVVFIDHEELGIIELPEGTSENDFTEEELDKMMDSEKLEDYPWAIHEVSTSFSNFIIKLEFEKEENIRYSKNISKQSDVDKIEESLGVLIPETVRNFLIRFGGSSVTKINANIYDYNMRITSIFSANSTDSIRIKSFIENRGGRTKFSNLVPFIAIRISNNLREISAIALYQDKQNKSEIVIIPHEALISDKDIKYEDLIVLTDDIKDFVDKITDALYA